MKTLSIRLEAPYRSAAGCLLLMLNACSVAPPPAAAPTPTSATSAAAPASPVIAAPMPAAAAPVAAPAAPIPVQPLDAALLDAAGKLFSAATSSLGAPGAQRLLVIDPLVDAVSYTQSVATQSMEARIQTLVRNSYPGFNVQPISRASIGQAPIVLVGTFTAIDLKNQVGGQRDAFRICLVLADLKSGLIVAKSVARAQVAGVNLTPLAHLQDAPTWAKDPAVDAYIRTCQASKVGDRIDPAYLDGILAGSLIAEASAMQDRGRYQEAVELYRSALSMPKGDQLRVYNGIYSAAWKLGRRADAEQAFGEAVRVGLVSNRLGVKFLFRPGSTDFVSDARLAAPYPMWLTQIAKKATAQSACLNIVGHTSPTGPEPLNERLSVLRAENVKNQLERESPPLKGRIIASGAGSKEKLVGTGTDDLRDALDRRVEFKTVPC